MQSLFDEIKNPLFRLMCNLVNEIHAGANLTRKDIKARIRAIDEFFYNEAPDFDREENIIDALFQFDAKSGTAQICIDAPISTPVTIAEIRWLKTFLLDEETAFLLPPNLREKLLARLENFPPLYEKNLWHKFNPTPSKRRAGFTFAENLSLIVQALANQKIISAQNKKIIPCRLEYDIFADDYFLISRNAETANVEKIPVANLPKISLTAENIPAETENLVQNFYSENAVELSLLVRNTRNAVERCFALFGAYDKNARIDDGGEYILTVKFLKHEEPEILERVISLGAAVTVLTPAEFRQKVIATFQTIKSKLR